MSKLRIYFNHCKIRSRNEQAQEFLLIFQQNFLIWKIIYLLGLCIIYFENTFPSYETIVFFSTNLNKRNKQLYPSYSLLIKHYTQFYTSQNTYNIQHLQHLLLLLSHLETHSSTCVKPFQPPLVVSTVARHILLTRRARERESNPRWTESASQITGTRIKPSVGGGGTRGNVSQAGTILSNNWRCINAAWREDNGACGASAHARLSIRSADARS